MVRDTYISLGILVYHQLVLDYFPRSIFSCFAFRLFFFLEYSVSDAFLACSVILDIDYS
jgi:hypothetical protein